MDVMVRNLHDQITEKQVDNFFRPILEKLGIKTYSCQKLKGRGCALLTILDSGKARQFLHLHGQSAKGAQGFASVRQKIKRLGQPVNCILSNKPPDPFLLRSLQKEESDRYAAAQSKKPKLVPSGSEPIRRAYDIRALACGQWDYVGEDLAFVEYYQSPRSGRIVFGPRSLLIKLRPSTRGLPVASPEQQLEIPYKSIISFTTGSRKDASLTFSLAEAPRMFEKMTKESASADSPDVLALALLSLMEKMPKSQVKRTRVTALDKAHETVTPSCLCYRLWLRDPSEITRIQGLNRLSEIPGSTSWDTSTIIKTTFAAQMTKLNSAFAGDEYNTLSFDLKFQLQALAQNGYLAPYRVLELLPVLRKQTLTTTSSIVVQSVQRLFDQIPYPGPTVEASELSLKTLTELLLENQKSSSHYTDEFGLADRYEHIISVHKCTVTPAGIYLYGPKQEVKNRVLRKYSAYPNHFLSVSFLDEDGEPLRHDRQSSNDDIFHVRFKRVLEGVINIAGRGYEFLGFSHSSLRSQTCWFMAPFTLDGALTYARAVINDLGDFSEIRSPAKCAARIGQAFSQTMSSIAIPPEGFQIIPDIERNGRTFSDGVGTCSRAVLESIWHGYSRVTRGLRPTVLQIRFQGAKGVISLDTRLQGTVLHLRPSMIKFGGTTAADIEICGSAINPLPMYLNRQLIKILEDLGVDDKAFLDLQASAVERLRMTTLSAINAATFFQRNHIGRAASLSWLIRKLWAIGLPFSEDRFLRDTLEIAVLIQLRELKHRTRIWVEKGVTLYGCETQLLVNGDWADIVLKGIMDETGILKEGQIYCSVHNQDGGRIITGNVVITRCPALHPGDVQCVTAVDVPALSVLNDLHNVIVFSSYGERDLPSMLSGGDLDGDLYNIIYDETLYPKHTYSPGDYPTPTPIDIRRQVEKSDITDFFLLFMQNDALGRIATLHQILADQHSDGTLNGQCLLLAELHSTAVDFSKTGIPVEQMKIPAYPKIRPDFLATGPRVLIDKAISLSDKNAGLDEADIPGSPDEDEVAEAGSYGSPTYRYYESQKVIGKLYREIDEHKFFEQIQSQSRTTTSSSRSLTQAVWQYVKEKVALIQWEHHIDSAKDIRDSYEENLTDTMQTYSTHPLHFVSEIEVFSGSILGKNGAQSKRQRDFSIDMKEKHERDVQYAVISITRGEADNSNAEALERSIACLYVACHTTRVRKKVGTLASFAWIAAAVCLKEVEKLQGGDRLL